MFPGAPPAELSSDSAVLKLADVGDLRQSRSLNTNPLLLYCLVASPRSSADDTAAAHGRTSCRAAPGLPCSIQPPEPGGDRRCPLGLHLCLPTNGLQPRVSHSWGSSRGAGWPGCPLAGLPFSLSPECSRQGKAAPSQDQGVILIPCFAERCFTQGGT